MKIVWLTWKDSSHPAAGGAEVVNEELAKRLVANGHEVKFVVGGFEGAAEYDTRDGYAVIRVGGRYSVYWHAYRYYKKHLATWPDVVIDEVNTIPFFAKYYAQQKNLLFVHQLCREVWWYQMPFPLSLIGYIAEPLYLWLLNDTKVITVSESTKRDLMSYGFKSKNISIISEGIEMAPAPSLDMNKYEKPTVLSLGSIRPMKRTDNIVRAFEIAKQQKPDLELIVAGNPEGAYGDKVLAMIKDSHYASSIHVMRAVSEQQKTELMQKSHVLAVASVKEGWGLVVTEANSQGTPAVVYDADGLRDSVRHGVTGLVTTRNSPESLADELLKALNNAQGYESMRKAAWQWSTEITFEKAYAQFIGVLTS